jgi:hypothetical protein
MNNKNKNKKEMKEMKKINKFKELMIRISYLIRIIIKIIYVNSHNNNKYYNKISVK